MVEVLINHGGSDVRQVGEILIGQGGSNVRHEMESLNRLRRIGYLTMMKS